MLPILGLYESHLTVSHLPTAIAFYRDRLRLELAQTLAERRVAFFWVGGPGTGMLGLWETGSGPNRMALHIAFRVALPRLLRACDDLAQAGIAPLDFHGRPATGPTVLGWMPAASVYFADPDGHSLELICPLPQPADPAFGVGPLSDWTARHGPPG